MATLTISVAASADDARLNDVGYDDTETEMNVGGTGTTNAGHGMGWRALNVTLTDADTINEASLSLMKAGAQWQSVTWRLTAIDEDDTATFSSGSPPGSRAITSSFIPDESLSISHSDGTRYTFPSTSGLRETLADAVAAVLARGGWSSGNALAIVCNSDQDASAHTGFGRENYHTYDSATADSEPQLVIDYTAGVGGGVIPQIIHHLRQQGIA